MSTDPKGLRSDWATDEALRHNEIALGLAASLANRGVVAAWGAAPKAARPFVDLAINLLGSPLLCLGTTKDGHPRHPLYLPKTTLPRLWRAA